MKTLRELAKSDPGLELELKRVDKAVEDRWGADDDVGQRFVDEYAGRLSGYLHAMMYHAGVSTGHYEVLCKELRGIVSLEVAA
jgi:hypothetical protein